MLTGKESRNPVCSPRHIWIKAYDKPVIMPLSAEVAVLEGTVHDKMLLAVSGFGQQFAGYVPQHKRFKHRRIDEERVCGSEKVFTLPI